jgi:putative phage-type endonuclease
MSKFYDTLSNGDTDRQAWLNDRKSIITASEVAAIMGVAPGAARVWTDKKGWTTPVDLSINDPGFIEMGHALEPVIAELYAKKTGRKIRRCQSLLRSKAYPWLGATLDYEIYEDKDGTPVYPPAPLECKSTGNADNWPQKGEPSSKYQVQNQVQMLVTGASWGAISAVIGQPFMHHKYQDFMFDRRFMAVVIQKTKEFFDSLQNDEPPVFPLDNSRSIKEAFDAVAVMAGTAIKLPEESVLWAKELARAEEEKRIADRTINQIKNQISNAISQHEQGLMPDGSGSWLYKEETRSAYSVKESKTRVLKFKKAPRQK